MNSIKLKNGWRLFRDLKDEEIIKALDGKSSYKEVFDQLGCKTNWKNRDKLRDFCNKKGISYDHLDPLTEKKYYENPKTCKYCGKIIPYEKRKNDFCNNSCAIIYNNRIDISKYETRKKNTKIKHLSDKYTPKEIEYSKKHNKLLDTKYSKLNIVHTNPGCCPICGEYHCTKQFCKDHNFQQLIAFVKYLNFDSTTIGTDKVFDEYNRLQNEIHNKYWIEKLSVLELRKIYTKVKSDKTMYNLLDYLGVSRRSFSESIKNSILVGKFSPSTNINMFNKNTHHGYYISWEGKKMFLRSSYEFDYAKELDNNKIRYEVEEIRIEYTDTVLNQIRIAIPDFYLPDTNEIVEIKSDFTLDIQEMLDKFDAYKKLGYNVKLILEHEEVDLYNIENLISKERLKRIKTKNIKILKIKDTNNNNTD
jgi:hypothetical protein